VTIHKRPRPPVGDRQPAERASSRTGMRLLPAAPAVVTPKRRLPGGARQTPRDAPTLAIGVAPTSRPRKAPPDPARAGRGNRDEATRWKSMAPGRPGRGREAAPELRLR
jgi:hypothetical protein